MPLVAEMTKDALLLGLKGQKRILLYSSKKGYTPDKFGLPWNLWALRVAGKNSPETHTLGKLLYFSGRNRLNFHDRSSKGVSDQ